MLLKNIGQNLRWEYNLHELVSHHIMNDTEPTQEDDLYIIYHNKPKFKELFKAYLALSEATRNKVKSYINLEIKEICLYEGCVCKEQIPLNEFKVIKELFEYLYNEILSKKLKEHYARLNQEICPFCTLKNLELSNQEDMDSFYREAYDHFLPISEYPWFGIKLDNLAPACNTCNSPIKGDTDPLNVSGTRKNILYPYQKQSKFKIHLKDIDVANPPIESIINFEISAEPANFQDSLNNLLTLYNLNTRFKTYFQSKARSLDGELIKELMKLYKDDDIQNISDIETMIARKIEHLNKLKFEHNSIFLKIAFYKYKQTRAKYIFERLKLAS